MRDITLDKDSLMKLGDLSAEVALRDANGKLVAYVVPPGHREMLYRLAANLFTDDEIEGARQEYLERGGKSLAEVLAHLEALVPEPAGQRT